MYKEAWGLESHTGFNQYNILACLNDITHTHLSAFLYKISGFAQQEQLEYRNVPIQARPVGLLSKQINDHTWLSNQSIRNYTQGCLKPIKHIFSTHSQTMFTAAGSWEPLLRPRAGPDRVHVKRCTEQAKPIRALTWLLSRDRPLCITTWSIIQQIIVYRNLNLNTKQLVIKGSGGK